MNTDTKAASTDLDTTPVWALCGCRDDAQIIHGLLSRSSNRGLTEMTMWHDGGRWTSRSRWYLTREELIEGEGIKPSCSKCEKPFATKSWCNPYPQLLSERNLCFGCNHWLHAVLPLYTQPGHVVVDGSFYSWDVKLPIVKITDSGQGYGHGGREFRIQITGGDLVVTNNLWSGGPVPERFREQMPDNATFEKYPEPVGHGQGFLS